MVGGNRSYNRFDIDRPDEDDDKANQEKTDTRVFISQKLFRFENEIVIGKPAVFRSVRIVSGRTSELSGE